MALQEINKGFQWLICHGKKVDFWRSNWATNQSLKQVLNIPEIELKGCTMRFSEFV